jgi:hypothetical protein
MAMPVEMKFCEKHRFEYMPWLSECPICAGEKMQPATRQPDGSIQVHQEIIIRQPPINNTMPKPKPRQMSLF